MNDRTVAWRDPDSSGATAGRCGAAGCVWAVGVGRVALLLWRGLALAKGCVESAGSQQVSARGSGEH